MSDRPIIMSAPMILALMAGRKTQTRRIIKPQPAESARFAGTHFSCREPNSWFWNTPHGGFKVPERYGVGDRLWVRETWAVTRYTLDYETGGEEDHFEWSNEYGDPRQYLNGNARFSTCASSHYAADGEEQNPSGFYPVKAIDGRTILRQAEIPWRSSSAMPRWASRLTLDVTDVRVQRLQDISEKDAEAEGVKSCVSGHDEEGPIRTFRTGFVGIWREIHGDKAWRENPWVTALTFTVHHGNIDARTPS